MRVIYEVYIDVYFVLNFMLFGSILLLQMRIMKQVILPGRLVLASLVGALCNCVGIYFRHGMLIMTFVSVLAANGIVFFRGGRRKVWEGFLYSAFLMALLLKMLDILQRVSALQRYGTVALALAISSLIVSISYLLKRAEDRKRQQIYAVVLMLGEQKKSVKAFLDSGNKLIDPDSGQPVCVVEKELLQDWIGEYEAVGKIKKIPFSSIGQSNGVLDGMEVSRMIIFQDGMEVQIKQPVIACYEGVLSSAGNYQMLLNQDLWKR